MDDNINILIKKKENYSYIIISKFQKYIFIINYIIILTSH